MTAELYAALGAFLVALAPLVRELTLHLRLRRIERSSSTQIPVLRPDGRPVTGETPVLPPLPPLPAPQPDTDTEPAKEGREDE